jgi:hypothetical protein
MYPPPYERDGQHHRRHMDQWIDEQDAKRECSA